MTEEEAKTKMCCGAQVIAMAAVAAAGRQAGAGLTLDAGRCIASACMAWRTRQRPVLRTEPWPDKGAVAVPAGRYGADMITEGYCGLAGAIQ